MQPVPAGSKTVEGKNIKARGTRTYKPKEPVKQDNFYENKNEEKKDVHGIFIVFVDK